MKTKIIEIPIYRNTLQVLFGDRSEIKETLISTYKESEEDATIFTDNTKNASGLYIYIESTESYYIWLQNIPDTISDYGVLIHELQHFVFRFLEDIGMCHTTDSDEAYSYLIEFIFCEIDIWISELRSNDNE